MSWQSLVTVRADDLAAAVRTIERCIGTPHNEVPHSALARLRAELEQVRPTGGVR